MAVTSNKRAAPGSTRPPTLAGAATWPPELDTRGGAECAENGRHQRRLGVGLGQAPGLEFGAARVDERHDHRQVPHGGDVGAEVAGGLPRSMSGSSVPSTEPWRWWSSSCVCAPVLIAMSAW